MWYNYSNMANQTKSERLTVISIAIAYLLVLSGVAAIFGVVVSQSIEQRVSSDISRIQRIASIAPTRELRDLNGSSGDAGFSIKFTSTLFRGDFVNQATGANGTGQLKNGDDICNAAYPGYRFCDTATLNAAGGSLPDPIAYANPFIGGWANVSTAFSADKNCNDWHSASEDLKGTRFYANGSTASRWWILPDLDKSCDTLLPLCCYK